ncbi:DivIVA domain-containing protein [Nonomuraea sp. bgisy101]|uniref:DivIVA domain-containing protein n=1 Tax=Nonomuraea sp. bgisy101 TaxID=3413784 RepID=UPI003D712824
MHTDHDETDHDHFERGGHESRRSDYRQATSSAGRAHADTTAGLLTASAVHHQVFSVVRLREGYDLAEVDAFLTRVETSLAQLWNDNTHLREQLAAWLAAEPAPSPNGAAARRDAEELITSAQQQAHEILQEARARAQTLHDEAQQAARALREQAHAPYRHLVEYHLGQLAGLATDHGQYLNDGLAAHLAQLRHLLADSLSPDPLSPDPLVSDPVTSPLARSGVSADQPQGPAPHSVPLPASYRPGHLPAGVDVAGSLIPTQPLPESRHRA